MNTLRSALQLLREALRDRLFPRRKFIADRRVRWGKPADKPGPRASAYFDRVRPQGPSATVDDKTWNDLELPQVFARIDDSISPIGGQYLYAQLRSPGADEASLAERFAATQRLRADAVERERLQWALAPLRDDEFGDLAGFLFGPGPRGPRHPGLLLAWSAACLLVAPSIWLLGVPGGVLGLMVAINAVALFRSAWDLRNDAEALKRCLAVLDVADDLAAAGGAEDALPAVQRLREQTHARRVARKKIGVLAPMQSELAQYFVTWLNLLCLTELVAYAFAIRQFPAARPALRQAWLGVGQLDAELAVASFLEQRPWHCRPSLVDESRIELIEAAHPLIDEPVRNTLRLDRQSALIAGSNMAGKTTLIKTVGLNILLAQTLGFCLAERAVLPRARVLASIRSEHSVASGKSRYFAEIEAIASFLRIAEGSGLHVFVIDELFSGTNTIERVAIARAVLERLAGKALVLVTSHDVELQAQLADRYALYHFQEDPAIEGFFDYRLRSGAATSRNAIALLAKVGFPGEVVRRALEHAVGAQSEQVLDVADDR